MAIDITRMIEPARQALAPVGSSLSDAWSAVIGDRIAAWRLKNAADLQVAVNREVRKLGLKLNHSKIPERYAFAWFEEATKQDEPEIQELFARLLAKASAGDKDASDRRHLEIVSRLTPLDAKVFELLFGPKSVAGEPSWEEYDAWKAIKEELGEDAALSLEHLLSLGILERTYMIVHDGSMSSIRAVDDMDLRGRDFLKRVTSAMTVMAELEPTGMGISLWSACAPLTNEGSE